MEVETLYASGSSSVVEWERNGHVMDLRERLRPEEAQYLRIYFTTPTLERIETLLAGTPIVVKGGKGIRDKLVKKLEDLGLKDESPHCGLEFNISSPSFVRYSGYSDDSLSRYFYLVPKPSSLLVHDIRGNTATILGEILSYVSLDSEEYIDLSDFFKKHSPDQE